MCNFFLIFLISIQQYIQWVLQVFNFCCCCVDIHKCVQVELFEKCERKYTNVTHYYVRCEVNYCWHAHARICKRALPWTFCISHSFFLYVASPHRKHNFPAANTANKDRIWRPVLVFNITLLPSITRQPSS